MTCLYPEHAIGIRAFRAVESDRFGHPRCLLQAIHGAKVGAWGWAHGRRIIYWERVTP